MLKTKTARHHLSCEKNFGLVPCRDGAVNVSAIRTGWFSLDLQDHLKNSIFVPLLGDASHSAVSGDSGDGSRVEMLMVAAIIMLTVTVVIAGVTAMKVASLDMTEVEHFLCILAVLPGTPTVISQSYVNFLGLRTKRGCSPSRRQLRISSYYQFPANSLGVKQFYEQHSNYSYSNPKPCTRQYGQLTTWLSSHFLLAYRT